jgi:hypothetical protein
MNPTNKLNEYFSDNWPNKAGRKTLISQEDIIADNYEIQHNELRAKSSVACF